MFSKSWFVSSGTRRLPVDVVGIAESSLDSGYLRLYSRNVALVVLLYDFLRRLYDTTCFVNRVYRSYNFGRTPYLAYDYDTITRRLMLVNSRLVFKIFNFISSSLSWILVALYEKISRTRLLGNWAASNYCRGLCGRQKITHKALLYELKLYAVDTAVNRHNTSTVVLHKNNSLSPLVTSLHPTLSQR